MTTHRYQPIDASQVPQHVRDGRWDVPLASQGQMVTVSYAAEGRYEAGPGAKYRRTHDASLAGGYHGHQYRYEVLVTKDSA